MVTSTTMRTPKISILIIIKNNKLLYIVLFSSLLQVPIVLHYSNLIFHLLNHSLSDNGRTHSRRSHFPTASAISASASWSLICNSETDRRISASSVVTAADALLDYTKTISQKK